MARVRACVQYQLIGCGADGAKQLGHKIMQVILEHIGLEDPFVHQTVEGEKYEFEFGFECPLGGDKEEDADMYVRQVVAHACQRAEISQLQFTPVSIETLEV